MNVLYLFWLVLIVKRIPLISSLCSSYGYSNKIRNILSKTNEYIVYEGKLIFRQNATFGGTNPSGIYGTPYFEFMDNITDRESVSPDSSYYLRSSSALIFAGCTPPKSIYFSLTSYINDRFNDYVNNTIIPSYKWLWADLGASLNNLVWNTTTNNHNISKNYNSLTTVIQTGDNKTFNDIYNNLIENGISSNEINLQSLPNKYINWLPYKYNNANKYEYNLSYDTGIFLLRVALTENENDYQQYINTNQTIFILQPKTVKADDNKPNEPFEPFKRNTYSTKNYNETNIYSAMLNEYKEDLINYLTNISTYNLTYISSMNIPNSMTTTRNGHDHSDYGFQCIAENLNCGGLTRDAQYYSLNHTLPLYSQFYIFLGVIHTNADIQQTLYSNIAYFEHPHNKNNHTKSWPSITNFEYNGSGLILPVQTNVNEKYLKNIFVVQLTRPQSCINQLPGFCYETDIIGSGTIQIRNYLNPITKTRPDINQIVPTKLITFNTN